MKLGAISFLTIMVLTASCRREEVETKADIITCTGVIEHQGITTYQYGSHIIGGDACGYALRSTTVNLDDYVGETVTVKGTLVEGYPVENGPDYLDVTEVIE